MVVLAAHQLAKAREPPIPGSEVLKASNKNIMRVYGIDLKSSSSGGELDYRQILDLIKQF